MPIVLGTAVLLSIVTTACGASMVEVQYRHALERTTPPHQPVPWDAALVRRVHPETGRAPHDGVPYIRDHVIPVGMSVTEAATRLGAGAHLSVEDKSNVSKFLLSQRLRQP